ncbi:hypothetical protein H671_5g14159 [Cricetulus griseus]|nr:hypothetical protein H671_5g14159 [Cricetulus griseus]
MYRSQEERPGSPSTQRQKEAPGHFTRFPCLPRHCLQAVCLCSLRVLLRDMRSELLPFLTSQMWTLMLGDTRPPDETGLRKYEIRTQQGRATPQSQG